MKPKVLFRADADSEIGYGHFIRSLALADILKNEFDCCFVTQSPTEYQKNEIAKICSLESLPNDDSRFNLFLEMLNGSEIVVLDNYFFSTEYQQRIKNKGCKLVCLDGMMSKHYVADAVVCQMPGAVDKDFSVSPYTHLCLGLEYVLLRKPFYNYHPKIKDDFASRPLNVFISFGGADKYNLTEKLIDSLADCDSVNSIIAIVGDGYSSTLKTNHSKVIVQSNVTAEQIVDDFSKCDVSILPCSTIMKEALACQMYVIGGYFVDNQIDTYRAYCSLNLIQGIGSFLDYNATDKVLQMIKRRTFILSNPEMSGISSSIPNKYIELFHSL